MFMFSKFMKAFTIEEKTYTNLNFCNQKYDSSKRNEMNFFFSYFILRTPTSKYPRHNAASDRLTSPTTKPAIVRSTSPRPSPTKDRRLYGAARREIDSSTRQRGVHFYMSCFTHELRSTQTVYARASSLSEHETRTTKFAYQKSRRTFPGRNVA